MRNTHTVLATVAICGAFLVAGCDVDKTKEGDVDVTLPEYKVTTPDVSVQAKEVEVTVPKVVTEKETVTVPTIDVKTANEKKAEGSN